MTTLLVLAGMGAVGYMIYRSASPAAPAGTQRMFTNDSQLGFAPKSTETNYEPAGPMVFENMPEWTLENPATRTVINDRKRAMILQAMAPSALVPEAHRWISTSTAY